MRWIWNFLKLWTPCTRRGREVACVREDVKLDEVFRLFMSSAVHMLLVRANSGGGAPAAGQNHPRDALLGEVLGLITLEDVMEELIQVGAAPGESSAIA